MNSSSCSFHRFMFVVFFVFLQCLNPTKADSCHPDDEAGLLAFKSGITNDPFGILSSWKKGTDCCSWSGTYCLIGNRVNYLEIEGDYEDEDKITLSGTLSPSLAKLQHLSVIVFSNLRNITGPFPKFLFKLPNLKYVYLDNNRLSGHLPTNIGALSSNLQRLCISGNQFTGPIPSSISNLTRLKILELNYNLLTGSIPLGFGNLMSIVQLNLDGNRLSGTIPDIFESLTNLEDLILSRNKFYGKLPPSTASLASNLTALMVAGNNLSGSIPTYLSKFKSLQRLDLSKNRFSGVVPKSLAIMFSKLYYLDLSHNLLTDPFPILRVKNYISHLDLSYNQFHLGTIPEWVATTSMPTIEPSVKLAKCGIKMNLSEWKPKLIEEYDSIDLSENDISGSPAKLLEGSKVKEFRASGNKLRFDMGKLNFSDALETLDLSRNLIFGKVPAKVATLKTLNLTQNHLCGKLPATKFLASVFVGNDCLCGPPLAPCKA